MSGLRDFINLQRKPGWIEKYRVIRIDGGSDDPEAIFFPLRLDTDPRAREAAELYAKLVEETNPSLAQTIREKIHLGEEIHARNSGYGQ